MALFDKVLGKDDKEKKLQQEINSLELRKESVSSAINNEIGRLQNEKDHILYEAGSAAYRSWCKKNEQTDLTEYWGKVKELEKEISEQESKKVEMGTRYDEEISLIRNDLRVNTTVNTSQCQCPNCKATVKAEDIFCQKCGAKLK